MVWCSRVLLRKYGNFVDNLRVLVKGGAGGMGLPRLGGEGGKGGDVWMVANKSISLKKIKDKFPHKRFIGGVGGNSSVRSLRGEPGAVCEVDVPVGITITSDSGNKIGDLNKEGDRLLVARGGYGGTFRTEFIPSKGQKRIVRLDLKLIADFGLVGFPNAGKSSLLGRLSHAKPQIADYAFTTVKPELGKIIYPDYKQISVADLPGLIEGAHINKGMGHKFLKHIERTKQLLFVVDVGGFQLSYKTPHRTAFETVQLLTMELELYKSELLGKPAILAVNKMDLPDAEDKYQELMEQLKNPNEYLHLLPDGLIPEHQPEFKYVLPISAETGQGIQDLISCVRKSIDEQADLETKEQTEKKLQSLQTMPSENTKRSVWKRPAATP
ncbi:GTP-binding protein 10 [Spea bombifrons]|uniref:GTP-binding protein 10 n=1 Tax=Spea bombifrons TaxID=233779 RepID=UPI0023497542|nr:GTP-binding protein 10 [Spea bombifrons]